ncbi:MAG: sigma-70 family RNA polymerase sigma factor [Geodermatophilaceae bacterium]|nr:sigma-70 family RNA polymerase sigma factor [Geodermatophilaceae bacterium]
MALVTRAAERPGGGDRSTDVDLMALVRAGEASGLEQLYDRYSRPAYSLARRILGDAGLAEDVLQEVFMALWRQPAKYDPSRGGFSSWLLAMTHHKAVDSVRREETLRRRRAKAAEDDETLIGEAGGGPDIDDQVLTSLQRDGVRRALRELPQVQREAVTLAYFGGYTQREVAALTGAPLGTVKTRMLAGMRRLRDILGGPAFSKLALDEGAGL